MPRTCVRQTSYFLRCVSFRATATELFTKVHACRAPIHSAGLLQFFKEAQLPLAAVTVVQVTPSSSTEARVVLRSDKAAAFVSVDSAVPGAFSDGAFTMLPAVDFPLTFTARNPLTAQQWTDEFAKGLQVRSLRDTYD